jgi:hypothetical protein
MITIDVDALASALVAKIGLERERSRWMTLAETAEYLRVSPRWLRDRLHEIPHRRIDGKLIFHAQEIDAWTETYREGN